MILDRLPVSRKLAVLVVVSLAGILATAAIGLGQLRSTMMEDREEKVKAVVDVAFAQVKAAESAQAAMDMVRAARYGNGDYIFILDSDGRIVMHPISPDLEGTNRLQDTDANGVHLFQDMLAVAKADGSGFVSYDWPKTAGGEPLPKITYVRALPDMGWVIGSGIYVDDVDEVFGEQALIFGGVVVVLILGLALLSTTVARGLAGPLIAMTKTMGI
jgi:methyl-accepting chemotaxis protein